MKKYYLGFVAILFVMLFASCSEENPVVPVSDAVHGRDTTIIRKTDFKVYVRKDTEAGMYIGGSATTIKFFESEGDKKADRYVYSTSTSKQQGSTYFYEILQMVEKEYIITVTSTLSDGVYKGEKTWLVSSTANTTHVVVIKQ